MISYWFASAIHAESLHDGAGGGGGGLGVLLLMHAVAAVEGLHPCATSSAVLNQQVPPDRTLAAHPALAVHREQHISFVAAGAESRRPCPRSHFGVYVHVPAVLASASAEKATKEKTRDRIEELGISDRCCCLCLLLPCCQNHRKNPFIFSGSRCERCHDREGAV